MLRFNLPSDDPEKKPDKVFRPLHHNGAGWVSADPPGPLPLYGLPSLNGEARVYVCEGEKCVDAARTVGLVASTSAHGANSPHKTDWTPLAGRDVVILPDHDPAGQKYATAVAKILGKLDPPATVRMLNLPDLPPGGDIVDYLEPMDAIEAEAIRDGIEKMAAATPTYQGQDDAAEFRAEPVLVRVADVKPEKVSWLWPERIPLGKVTLIAGDLGLGKSFLTLDIAAHVSTGRPWPVSPDTPAEVGSVILLSAEDDIADTIRPRLDAAAADVEKIVFLQAVRYTEQSGTRSRWWP